MSYQVGSVLCSDRSAALVEIVASWLYAAGLNDMVDVAEMSVDGALAEMKESGCEYEAASMPPKYDDEGTRVYEDLEPTDAELASIVRTAIDEARERETGGN